MQNANKRGRGTSAASSVEEPSSKARCSSRACVSENSYAGKSGSLGQSWVAMKIAALKTPPDHIAHVLAAKISGLEADDKTVKLEETFGIEQSFTATMAFFLQQLFSVANFEVAHQRPLWKCIPDILISLPPAKHTEFFAVSDGKQRSQDDAIKATRLYSVRAWEDCKTDDLNEFFILAFPFTRSLFHVELHIISTGLADAVFIPIVASPINDVSQLASALYKLTAGVEIIQDVRKRNLTPLCPKEEWATHKGRYLKQNVFHNETLAKICKVFPITDERQPNTAAIMAAGCLSEVKEELTEFTKMLTYSFLPGDTGNPKKIKHFVQLAEILIKLHAANYVHCDIRGSNLIFSEENAAIIDFDLAAQQGALYQVELAATSDSVRHWTATKSKPCVFIHDVSALLGFMNLFAPDTQEPSVLKAWGAALVHLHLAPKGFAAQLLTNVVGLQEFQEIKLTRKKTITPRSQVFDLESES
eukprot:TRINITY_DN68298_c0_g1_i1.p1 TRINITY_DN68298_c0_g1~~TRINITY_DN68298_c0_g1_i1.p1  ORF type:complete len:474 (-),score=71.97 TRINITY_DN68298_c0_g1_i1:44-1465(-)